jgi:hypothetical protein
MDINIQEKQTGHLMTDLGIKSERCEELCSAIEQSIHELHDENPDEPGVSLAAVVKRALTHAKDDNEAVFVSITAGEYMAQYRENVKAHMEGQIQDFLGGLKEAFNAARSRRQAAYN